MKNALKWLSNWLYEYWFPTFIISFLIAAIFVGSPRFNGKANEELKEYKDGIQNRLVWSASGACFFVRPSNDDVTVYLVKVPDCEKGK